MRSVAENTVITNNCAIRTLSGELSPLARKSHHFVSGSRRYSTLQRYSVTERILVVFVREAKAL